MTRSEILRMARESWEFVDDRGQVALDILGLHRFAALVAAAEREACANACEERGQDALAMDGIRSAAYEAALDCANIIRARGDI